LTLTLVVQTWYEYQLKWSQVPRIVGEMSGNFIASTLESGHPVSGKSGNVGGLTKSRDCQEKLFIVNFTFWATPVLSSTVVA